MSDDQMMAQAGSDTQVVGVPHGFSLYSRGRVATRYAATHRARQHNHRVAVGVVATITLILVAAIAITLTSALGFVGSIGSRINAGVDDATRAMLLQQQEEAQRAALANLTEEEMELPANWQDTTPFYMLLIGTDRSESRAYGEESWEYGSDDANFRSDVMILARIDPGNKKVTLVSIHRDTYVAINGVYQKINAAYSYGGVAKVIEVVSNYCGVPISHFAQVDIDGLAAVVDAMGGVTVEVPYEINDEEYAGYLPAGLQTLNGQEALIFTRSRHAYDAIGDGDRYRAAHQRLFLSAMAQQLFASSVPTMVNVINTVADYVTTDLTLDQILSLAMTMRDMSVAEDFYSTMNPTYAQVIDGIYYEITIDSQWQEIMSMVDAGEKPPVDSGYRDPLNDINNPDYVPETAFAEAAQPAPEEAPEVAYEGDVAA